MKFQKSLCSIATPSPKWGCNYHSESLRKTSDEFSEFFDVQRNFFFFSFSMSHMKNLHSLLFFYYFCFRILSSWPLLTLVPWPVPSSQQQGSSLPSLALCCCLEIHWSLANGLVSFAFLLDLHSTVFMAKQRKKCKGS